MPTEDEITRMIRGLQNSYEEAKEKNNAIQAQIDDLECALRWANLAEQRAESLERSVKTFKISSKWVGGYREPFGHALTGSLKTSTDAYENDIHELKAAIRRKIAQLQLQKNHFVSLISSCEKRIDKAWKDLSAAKAE